MLEWTTQFETGSAKLDQQHQVLIDHINLLGELLEHPQPTKAELAFINQLVNYLEAYADLHFRGEEQCMASYQCPAHAQNQQEHERFRAIIHEHKTRWQLAGFQLELLAKLHVTMETWITEHILNVDTLLRPCIPSSKWFAPSDASAS